jgi:hypothetical protein
MDRNDVYRLLSVSEDLGRAAETVRIRHDGSPFVEEENVGNGNGCDGFGSAGTKAHENSTRQESGIRLFENEPYGRGKVYRIARDIHRPTSILVCQRHPEKVSSALEKSGGCEEVGDSSDGAAHRRIREEFDCSLHDSDGRACIVLVGAEQESRPAKGTRRRGYYQDEPAAKKLHTIMATHMTAAI